MTKRIYLVEDEKSLNLVLKRYLEMEGYDVTSFLDGNSAMERIKDLPDLWILDIMLPDIDGYQLIKTIKEFNPNTPVIFISARNEELDRVVGLELGSDDYLSKPFLPRELVIRTNKLIDRIYIDRSEQLNNVVNFGEYILDEGQRLIFWGNDEISLTLKELNMLKYLVDNKNMAISREQILFKVWGEDYFGTDRVVDDTLRRIRKKLVNLDIETIYGFGYKLVIK
ncbi:response regulator transcription factor [Wukongibacter baidiensis]|uniref:response regulator transcription factor n=1 Tax=Wukongibacter baidiensis TaxID=1723361 RepID=UPI003D7FE0FA